VARRAEEVSRSYCDESQRRHAAREPARKVHYLRDGTLTSIDNMDRYEQLERDNSGYGLAPLVPEWPAPAGVRSYSTTRIGGVSPPPFDSLNLGMATGDEPGRVAENRTRIVTALGLPETPRWLRQSHGTRVVATDEATAQPIADGSTARRCGEVCAVLTADCVPILLCDSAGRQVGAAHAGWRGLAAGILESSVSAFDAPPADLLAWLGPGIGPDGFEVGPEVREAFVSNDPGADEAFRPSREDRLLADLYMLARRRLAAAGVEQVYGGGLCTYRDAARFFSHRRDGRQTGRMATLIWMEA
jgi:YfiH family protein